MLHSAEGQGAGGPSKVQGNQPTTNYFEVDGTLMFDGQLLTAVDHASAPSFKSEANSTKEPTSTGKTFQPGSWTPGQ